MPSRYDLVGEAVAEPVCFAISRLLSRRQVDQM